LHIIVRCWTRLLGSAAQCYITFRKLNNENIGREHVQIQPAESKGSVNKMLNPAFQASLQHLFRRLHQI